MDIANEINAVADHRSPARDRRDDVIKPVAERIRVVVGKGRDDHHARAYALNGRLQVAAAQLCPPSFEQVRGRRSGPR